MLAIAVTGVMVARRRWRDRYHERLIADARLVTVLAPPTVDPTGAITVWSNLVGLLRPGWRRRFSGQPHLTFELTFTADGVQIRLWVPGLVPPGMVERAIEAAWPGAHTRTTPAKPPIPTPRGQDAASKRSAVNCGWRDRRRCRSAPSTLQTRSEHCSARRSGSARMNEPACRSSPVRSPATA